MAIFFTVEIHPNNLLVEATREVRVMWPLSKPQRTNSSALFSARLFLTFSVGSYASKEISRLGFQGRMTSPRLCVVPWQAGNARSKQRRYGLSHSLLSLRGDLPGQRGIWVLQNATAKESGTEQNTPPKGQETLKTSGRWRQDLASSPLSRTFQNDVWEALDNESLWPIIP